MGLRQVSQLATLNLSKNPSFLSQNCNSPFQLSEHNSHRANMNTTINNIQKCCVFRTIYLKNILIHFSGPLLMKKAQFPTKIPSS